MLLKLWRCLPYYDQGLAAGLVMSSGLVLIAVELSLPKWMLYGSQVVLLIAHLAIAFARVVLAYEANEEK